MEWSVSLLVYVVVQFIAFLFVVVGTPIDMFRYIPDGTMLDKSCITLWGSKFNCTNTSYTVFSDRLWAVCPARRSRFRVAQAFAVISVFVYGMAFALGVIMLFCCRCCHWFCLALNVVGAVTLCIVWAAMVITYNKNEGFGCLAPKVAYAYGAGFVLLVVAWVLDLLNIAVLLFPFPVSGSGEMGKVTKSNDEEQEEKKVRETKA